MIVTVNVTLLASRRLPVPESEMFPSCTSEMSTPSCLAIFCRNASCTSGLLNVSMPIPVRVRVVCCLFSLLTDLPDGLLRQ
jgi:hypothetical protein